MNIYIALLRGINVGGKNMIKMAELKKVFENMGLSDVKTYIQSGNVLFKSDDNEDSLKTKIENEIEQNFGFSISVIIRTAAELENILNNRPFSEEEISRAEELSKVESLYVALLDNSPLEEKVELWKKYKSENDEYKIDERNIYLLFKNSIRNSKLASNIYRLGITTTVRNWKTMSKLFELAKAMED